MTRYALVPVEATEEMIEARQTYGDTVQDCQADWAAAIAVSPGGGRVTAEMVEKAAEAYWNKALEQAGILGHPDYRGWDGLSDEARRGQFDRQRAALAALGLQVEGDGQ